MVRADRDEGAEALFTVEYPRLAAWCSALAGDAEVGAEIAAEAFARLLARWRTVERPRAFLYTVAANLLNDRWRREQRHRRGLRLLAVTAARVEPGPDTSVRDLIARLPDRQRLAVLLHYYAQLSTREVAQHLDAPESTVRRWLAEARATLRSDLQDAR